MTVTEQLSALSAILAHCDLHSLFQPIVSLSDRRILGYEALTRGPSNSALHSPVSLFGVARQAGRSTARGSGKSFPCCRCRWAWSIFTPRPATHSMRANLPNWHHRPSTMPRK